MIRQALKGHGVAVASVDGVAAAKQVLADRTDVVRALVDLRLRDGSGFERFQWITTHRPEVAARAAFVSGGGTELARRVAGIGRPVLEKPFDLATLCASPRTGIRSATTAGRDASSRDNSRAL